MPADATDLACAYYFNNTKKLESINELSYTTNQTGYQFNQNSDSIQKMELYKAKPQYLNTYNLAGSSNINNNTCSNTKSLSGLSNSIQCAASSLVTIANSTDSSASNTLFKNSLWLDLQWSKIKTIGAGLYNLGNNCYLNATLQCMAYTPSLSQWLVNKPHSPVCKIKPIKGFCSLCEVEKIIYDIFNSYNGCAKPNSLCFNIKKVSNVFGVGTQEDASEFFTTLLESMAQSIKFVPSTSSNLNSIKNINILDEIFSFQFRSRITCCNCGRLSDTFENTNSWPVDVKYVNDIRKGMLHFLKEEVLEGENSYKCDRCNRKVKATKKYSLQTAPNVLVVNLKRFDFTYAGKLTHFVTYPETLCLKNFIGENEHKPVTTNSLTSDETYILRNVAYKLYGVLVHLGYTSHSGHYYSYVRGPNDVWYKADDQQISTVRIQDALDQNAYILFYNRITPTKTATSNSIERPKMSTYCSSTLIPEFNLAPKLEPSHSIIKTFSSKQNDESTLEKNTQTSVSPIKNIPEVTKFKSTFLTVNDANILQSDTPRTSLHSTKPSESKNSNRTLDYDQVLKIKKLNKRKLKLLNRKNKLRDLKNKKKTLSDESEVKRIKKRIKKFKKLIKREKSKIRKLKKYESCSSDQTDDEDDDYSDDISQSNKRKNSDDKANESKSNEYKKSKTTDSLSLLKQYSSSSSTSSEDESCSHRSSRSSSRFSYSSNESKSNHKSPKNNEKPALHIDQKPCKEVSNQSDKNENPLPSVTKWNENSSSSSQNSKNKLSNQENSQTEENDSKPTKNSGDEKQDYRNINNRADSVTPSNSSSSYVHKSNKSNKNWDTKQSANYNDQNYNKNFSKRTYYNKNWKHHNKNYSYKFYNSAYHYRYKSNKGLHYNSSNHYKNDSYKRSRPYDYDRY